MGEIDKIIITSTITIISGTIIFSITKLIEKFYITPINDLQKIRGEIAISLMNNSNKFGNKSIFGEEQLVAISNELRLLAAELKGTSFKLRMNYFLTLVNLSIKKENISAAASELIGLSNSILNNDFTRIDNYQNKIKELLQLN